MANYEIIMAEGGSEETHLYEFRIHLYGMKEMTIPYKGEFLTLHNMEVEGSYQDCRDRLANLGLDMANQSEILYLVYEAWKNPNISISRKILERVNIGVWTDCAILYDSEAERVYLQQNPSIEGKRIRVDKDEAICIPSYYPATGDMTEKEVRKHALISALFKEDLEFLFKVGEKYKTGPCRNLLYRINFRCVRQVMDQDVFEETTDPISLEFGSYADSYRIIQIEGKDLGFERYAFGVIRSKRQES